MLDHDLVKGVVGHMNKLKSAPVLWNGYRPEQGHYVFTVPGPERQRCAVVWRDGAIVDVLDLAVAPRLLTPLFGVLLPEERIKPTGAGAPDPAGGFRQPDQLRDQLRGRGVSHTVFIPLGDLPKMPFQLGSFEHFDLAVHEAFHTFVQTPSWVGMDSAGAWPSWDRPQPDRLQLATRCYGSATPQEQQRLRAEKAPLVTAALGALTSGNAQTVCRDTAAFVRERRRRWSELSAVQVASDDGSGTMSCAEAETIMEMDEGLPDFVAWMTSYEIGAADATRVRQRFEVAMRDQFYVMGTMQLAVLRQLVGDDFSAVTRRIAASSSWESGGIFTHLSSQLPIRCTRTQ